MESRACFEIENTVLLIITRIYEFEQKYQQHTN